MNPHNFPTRDLRVGDVYVNQYGNTRRVVAIVDDYKSYGPCLFVVPHDEEDTGKMSGAGGGNRYYRTLGADPVQLLSADRFTVLSA